MRRLIVAAVIGTFVLSACGEQSQQPGTAPRDGAQPSFDKGVPCPTTAFPLSDANAGVNSLYPTGTLRTNALARVFDISKKWSQCKVADPQGKVGTFVLTLLQDYAAGRLTVPPTATTADRVKALINTMYSGVGLTAPNLPVGDASTDFGFGLFVPGTKLLVQTTSKNAATLLPANAFTENTLISIVKLTDNAPFGRLTTNGETQYPPFYDINASNNSQNHFLTTGVFGIVGFCVDQAVLDAIAGNFGQAEIGHNIFGDGFEILAAALPAEYASLGLVCATQANPASIGSRHSGPIGNLALGAWEAAKVATMSLFLPQPAEASILTTTGVGGRASSYSPFGVVDALSGGY